MRAGCALTLFFSHLPEHPLRTQLQLFRAIECVCSRARPPSRVCRMLRKSGLFGLTFAFVLCLTDAAHHPRIPIPVFREVYEASELARAIYIKEQFSRSIEKELENITNTYGVAPAKDRSPFDTLGPTGPPCKKIETFGKDGKEVRLCGFAHFAKHEGKNCRVLSVGARNEARPDPPRDPPRYLTSVAVHLCGLLCGPSFVPHITGCESDAARAATAAPFVLPQWAFEEAIHSQTTCQVRPPRTVSRASGLPQPTPQKHSCTSASPSVHRSIRSSSPVAPPAPHLLPSVLRRLTPSTARAPRTWPYRPASPAACASTRSASATARGGSISARRRRGISSRTGAPWCGKPERRRFGTPESGKFEWTRNQNEHRKLKTGLGVDRKRLRSAWAK